VRGAATGATTCPDEIIATIPPDKRLENQAFAHRSWASSPFLSFSQDGRCYGPETAEQVDKHAVA
jgi:hypothetical protein